MCCDCFFSDSKGGLKPCIAQSEFLTLTTLFAIQGLSVTLDAIGGLAKPLDAGTAENLRDRLSL